MHALISIKPCFRVPWLKQQTKFSGILSLMQLYVDAFQVSVLQFLTHDMKQMFCCVLP